MSQKTIPAKTIITCDRCGKTGEKGGEGAFYHGGIHIRKADWWMRSPAGDTGGTTHDWDFCEDCAVAFANWLGYYKSDKMKDAEVKRGSKEAK
jgi:hypothetical protein